MKKISICASMPMHSYDTAKGIIKSKMLDRYYSSVYNDNSLLYKLMQFMLPKRISKRVINKKCKILNKYVKKYCEYEGLFVVGSGYIPIKKIYIIKLLNHMNKRFGKLVAKDIINRDIDAIIAYDTYANDLFDYLRKKNSRIIKILDMASISSKIIKIIIDEECEKKYPFLDTMTIKKQVYSENIIKNNVCEILSADYLLAASRFCAESLIQTGVIAEKIKIVPYGINIDKFYFKDKKINKDSLTFLFVGRLEAAKGIWYLFEAFNDERIKNKNIKLRVVGDIRTDKSNLIKYSENIIFEGLKQYDEMPKVYAESDVYILSSLWEGFSFSLLEAMASGLPAIATKNSAAPEIISNYMDGILINSQSVEEIVEAILWFDNNREKLPLMSKNAREKIACNYTLEHYYQRLNHALKEILT